MRHSSGMPYAEPVVSEGPYTWDDFVALEEDDRRELIDGELVEVEVPSGVHEQLVSLLSYHLTGWTKSGHGGRVLASGFKVQIAKKRGLMPDVQLYRGENTAQLGAALPLGEPRPDLVIENISPSSGRYDRVIKLRYYASRGVPEYWVVDHDLRTIERLVLRDDLYVIAGSCAGDEIFRPDSFEGLEIPLADLWSVRA